MKCAQSLVLNALLREEFTVLSLSLGGSRSLACHRAKKMKVTFGWCGTDRATSRVIWPLCWCGRAPAAFSFSPKVFITICCQSYCLFWNWRQEVCICVVAHSRWNVCIFTGIVRFYLRIDKEQ